MSGGVTAFYTDYENKIVNTGSNGILGPDGQPVIDQDTGVGLSTYYNVTGAHVYGVELQLGYKFNGSPFRQGQLHLHPLQDYGRGDQPAL